MSEQQENLSTSEEAEQFVLSPTYEKRDHSYFRSYPQFDCNNSRVAESQDLNEDKHGDFGDSETEPKKRHCRRRGYNVLNFNISKINCNSNTSKMSFRCDMCRKDCVCQIKKFILTPKAYDVV